MRKLFLAIIMLLPLILPSLTYSCSPPRLPNGDIDWSTSFTNTQWSLNFSTEPGWKPYTTFYPYNGIIGPDCSVDRKFVVNVFYILPIIALMVIWIRTRRTNQKIDVI